MRRVRAAVAGITVAAMTLGVAAPAGAQDEEPAGLGLAVDKTEAQPGALVLGKAEPADVEEHCATTVEEVQARFQAALDEVWFPPGTKVTETELFLRFFPEGEFDFQTHEQAAYAIVGFIMALIAGQIIGPGPAEQALPQLFVMTFADIDTQEPVGERTNFDPDTGEGSVVVPDVEPGLWAFAAVCVGPSFDIDVVEAAIREAGAFLEEIGMPDPPGGTGFSLNSPEMVAFMQDFLDSDATGLQILALFLEEITPTVLEPMMVPDALGAVLFCVLDPEGKCPADEPPPPPPGEQIDLGDDQAGPAQPIVAAPTFTG